MVVFSAQFVCSILPLLTCLSEMCLLFWLLFPQGTQLLTWSLTWIAHLSCDKKYIVTCTSSIYDLKCQSHVTWRNWSVTVPTEVFPCLPSSWVIVVASTLKTMHLKHALIISNALAAWAYCETRNGDILLVHNANWIKHHHLLYCLFQSWKIVHTYLLWM